MLTHTENYQLVNTFDEKQLAANFPLKSKVNVAFPF